MSILLEFISLTSCNIGHQILGRVQPEEQTADISSTVETEDLRVTLRSLAGQSKTQEVQQVDVVFSNTDGTFRLGMNKAYTGICYQLAIFTN